MGWAFRDLRLHDERHDNDDEFDRVHRELKRREHTHTAFDRRVELPDGFVGPALHTKPKPTPAPQKKSKKPAVYSAAYSKRTSGSTTSSSTQKREMTTATATPTAKQKKPTHHNNRSHRRSRSPLREEPVDFVYDVDVRRRLREQMDAARLETLRQVAEKEKTLRAEHRWVGDAATKPAVATRGVRQAWQPTEAEEASPAAPSARQHTGTRADRGRGRPKTATAKTSIAPNVSEWRTQQVAFHASAETQHAQRQRLAVQQQRDSDDLARTIDAFERHWGSS